MATATQELRNPQLSTLLHVQQLSVEYGAVQALADANIEVHRGEIVALIGPNGAGKSTALRAIAGILYHYDGRIAGGDIEFEGRRINGMPPHKLIKLGLALVPENRHVFPTMTVLENLEMGGYTIRRPETLDSGPSKSRRQLVRERMERVFELFPRLKERRKQRAGTLSTGEQQMRECPEFS